MFGKWWHEGAGSVIVCIPLPWKDYADGIFFLVPCTCRHLGNSCSHLFLSHSAVAKHQQGCYRWQLKIHVVLASSLQPASEFSWQRVLLTDSWLLQNFRSWWAQGVNWNEVTCSLPSRVKILIIFSFEGATLNFKPSFDNVVYQQISTAVMSSLFTVSLQLGKKHCLMTLIMATNTPSPLLPIFCLQQACSFI